MAKRIQRKRTKGWRMPEGAVYVGRPTKWANPYLPYATHTTESDDGTWSVTGPGLLVQKIFDQRNTAVAYSIMLFGLWLLAEGPDLSELSGKDLVCWCPLDQPCHADVLLEIANG